MSGLTQPLEPGKMVSHDWGSMTWLVDDSLVPAANVSVAKMWVLPGQLSPAHRHDDTNEVIHVLEGALRERIGDDWIIAMPGETVFVPMGTVHQSQCLSETPVSMLISYSNGSRHYQEVDE